MIARTLAMCSLLFGSLLGAGVIAQGDRPELAADPYWVEAGRCEAKSYGGDRGRARCDLQASSPLNLSAFKIRANDLSGNNYAYDIDGTIQCWVERPSAVAQSVIRQDGRLLPWERIDSEGDFLFNTIGPRSERRCYVHVDNFQPTQTGAKANDIVLVVFWHTGPP